MRQYFSAGALLCLVISSLLPGCTQKRNTVAPIRIRWAHDPENLDPMQLVNQSAIDVNNLLNGSLLQPDVVTHEYAPALADSLPVVQLSGDSLMRLRYRIRTAAAWDDGRPVLAHDVAFTLKLMFCPGLRNEMPRRQYGFIQDVLADPHDPRRFTLLCHGQALDYVKQSGEFFVLSEAALDPRGQLRHFSLRQLQHRPDNAPPDAGLQAVASRYTALNPAQTPARLPGCGPYQLVKWEKDRYLTFRRKPRWWANQVQPQPLVLRAKAQELQYVIIPDATTATLALRRGDLDVFPQVPVREFERLRASAAARTGLQLSTTPSYDVVAVGFNTRRPTLADALTRQALSRCFDAAGLLQAAEQGQGQRTVGFIHPTDRTNYNDSLAPLPFDPTKAQALLRQAGWRRQPASETGWQRPSPRGAQQLQPVVRYRTDDLLFATIALQFQAAAASIGVPVTLQPTESGAFSMALKGGEFDMYVRTLRGNPFMFNYISILHSAGFGAGNSMGFATPASDRLIEAIAAADDKAQRARLLRRFQALMQQEAPLVPLFFLSSRIAADRHLSGLYVSGIKPGYSAATIERASGAAAVSTP